MALSRCVISRIRAEIDNPGVPHIEPRPIIGADGRRLVMRNGNKGVKTVLSFIAWCAFYIFIYAIPAIFAFAGFMSIIDGR